MTNILEVGEMGSEGYYPVRLYGREFALVSPFEVRTECERSSFHATYHPDTSHEVSIRFVELPPKPKPKPKRRITDLGLRRPK